MVFRYPPRPSLDYIKRVVGTPGDEVAYLNKRLTVNGKPVPTTALPEYFDEDAMRYFPQFEEALSDKPHRLLNDPARPAMIAGADDFPFARIAATVSRAWCARCPRGTIS
jgi:signal peptidase I